MRRGRGAIWTRSQRWTTASRDFFQGCGRNGVTMRRRAAVRVRDRTSRLRFTDRHGTSPAGGAGMAERWEEPWTQLATRIPKALHQRLKLHCVESDTSLMDFVVAAIREKLGGGAAAR